jgi:hypothetical protein
VEADTEIEVDGEVLADVDAEALKVEVSVVD